MKIAEIDWPLFWQVWRQQNAIEREHWLARWVFGDDVVRLSMHPVRAENLRETGARENKDSSAIKVLARHTIGTANSGPSDYSEADFGSNSLGVCEPGGCLYPRTVAKRGSEPLNLVDRKESRIPRIY